MTTTSTAGETADIAAAAASASGSPASTESSAGAPAASPASAETNAFAEEDAALAAAIAEQARIDAEQAKAGSAKADSSTSSAPDKPQSQAPATTPAAKAAADASGNASTSAIIALRKQNQDLKNALLVTSGENKALKALVDPNKFSAEGGEGSSAPDQKPATIEEAFTTIEQEREALAAKVDNGQLTMAEYTREFNRLGREERDLLAQQAAELAASRATPQTDLGLEEATNQLIKDFPILNRLTAAQLDPLKDKAFIDAEFEGNPIPDGPIGTKMLRERMAVLAEQKYDPDAHRARQANGGKLPGAGNGQPRADGKPAPTAQQREDKLRLAAEMPLNIGNGGSGASAGELTEDQIEAAMSGNEDQRIAFMNSHPALIQKVMGPGYRVRR